jgi:hypothetical protein
MIICALKLRRSQKASVGATDFQTQDSNELPPRYKSQVLTFELTHFIASK